MSQATSPGSGRTMTLTVVVVVAAVSFTIWGIWPGSAAGRRAGPVAAAGQPESPGASRPAPPEVGFRLPATRATAASETTVRVVDVLTLEPLEAVALVLADDRQTARSGADGNLSVASGDLLTAPTHARQRRGPDEVTLRVASLSPDERDPSRVVAAVAATARLTVRVIDTGHRSLTVDAFLIDYPDLPTASSLPAEALEALEFARPAPRDYVREFDRLKLSRRPVTRALPIALTGGVGGETVTLAYEGPCALTVSAAGCTMWVQAVALTLGTDTPVAVRIDPSPRVGGTVTDGAGTPVPGALVWVVCQSRVAPGGFYERVEGCRGAMALVTDRITKVCVQEYLRTVACDTNGRFEDAVPFTGDVAAYLAAGDTRLGLVERHGDARQSHLDLALQALPRPRAPRIKFVDNDTGNPLADCVVRFASLDRWHVQYPPETTDSEGYVRTDLVVPDATRIHARVLRGKDRIGREDNISVADETVIRVKTQAHD